MTFGKGDLVPFLYYAEHTGEIAHYIIGHVKKNKDTEGNIKVFYRVYDYKSNPILKDTDFDGMDDADDGRPKDNKFQGMAKIERNQNLVVNYHNDYRHFFIDNNKYNSELAEMSLMISNLANDEERKLNIYQGGIQVGMMNTGGVFIGDMNITEYLTKIGFIPLETMSLSNGKAYLSYKIVNYYGKEKLIFGIFIGGFDDEESYIKFITDTNNMHQNYEGVVNSVVSKIDNLKSLDLIKQYFNSQNYCYFITGKGIGGAVAAEVATKLGDTHNIYCYTFGMPNIKNSSTLTYIKNIVNEDDLLTKIHSDIGQDGDVYNKSIYWDLIPEYRYYVESPNRYKGNYKKTNTIRNNLEDIKRMISSEGYNSFIIDEAKYLYSQIGGRIAFDSYEIFNHIRDNVNYSIEEKLVEIEEFTDTLTTANSTKAYWCLVKTLDGYDSKYYYGEEKKSYTETMVYAFTTSEEEKEEIEKTLLDCIEEMGVWYVNHVATYNHKIYAGSGSRDYYNRARENARAYLKQYANITEPVNNQNKNFTLKDNQNKIIEGSRDILLYENEELLKVEKNLTMPNPGYVGDGCNMYATAVIRLFKEGNIGSITGVTSENMRSGSSTFDNAMYNLGFKKYQLVGDNWKCMSKDNTMGENVEMSLEELKPGDMLLRDNENEGHIEFYIGHKYERTDISSPLKTKNCGSIDDIKDFTVYKRITNELGQKVKDPSTLKIVQGKKGTFSWGTTHDVFPVDINNSPNNYYYFTYNENNSKKFKLRYSYNYDDAGVSYDDIGDYDTIWRYE